MASATHGRIALPDRYRVVRHIANGGMASVWAAEDGLLCRLVAVKVLAPGFSDPSASQRFMREARAAARVSDHPHVVTIYDVGEENGQAFIVMEHFAGGSVADRLRRPHPIPRRLAMEWLDGAASALDYAHSRDIVHRDVKPGNLLLDSAERVAVADFGIARIATDSALTQTGQVLGTAAYLSPEQSLGKPATAASDRYALAVVAYELLTGSKPFPAALPAAQARAHADSPVPAASKMGDVPVAVDAVLERGLAKNPDDRPLTATAFVESLRGALGREDETAPTSVAPARPRREPAVVAAPAAAAPAPRTRAPRAAPASHSRRPFLIALAAIVFVLAAVIAAIAGGGGGDAAKSASTPTTASKPAKHKAKAKAKPKPAATTPPQTQTQTQAQTQAAAPPTTSNKSALEAQGHNLIVQGNYAAAIPVLRKAIAGCPVATTDPCAYAYFDLGHALRLAGQPSAAIPILQTRLQNPDQRGAVQQELALAQQQAGGGGGTSSGPGPGKGKKGKGD